MNGEVPVPAGGNPDAEERVAYAAVRGVIAAMAMTGMRSLTVGVGLVRETPPRAIVRQTSKGLFRVVPEGKRRAAVELMHWGYGAAGGASFAVLPEQVRMKRWAGPVYGLILWLGFEMVQAPVLGLDQAKKARPVERVALAMDHLLYGLVVSEFRSRSRE
ncbi:MAG: DUF1440 domain-containing protein [Actinomycetota bacterium]|nr:DUF1440 domain-containing protein [Actinomycetota bacterium]